MSKYQKDPVIKFFISAIGVIAIFSVLIELQHIFVPLVLAYFLYFVFEPLNKIMERKGVPSSITILIDLLIVSGVVWGISRLIIESFNRFGRELPVYEQKLNSLISSTAIDLGFEDPLLTQFNISEILQNLDYGGFASGFFSSTVSIFSGLFFVLFFYLFIGSGHKRILAAIKSRFKYKVETDDAKKSQVIEDTFKAITTQVQRYIATKFFVSLLTGLITGVVLWIFGVDFVIVWAVLAFLLNFIPNIGSTMAVIFPTILALVQFESFGITILIGSILIAIQTVIGNILEPKILGDRLGLNPLAVLLSLLIWGYVWGLIGMFLSVPLTAIVKIILSNTESKNLKFFNDLIST